MSEEHKHKSRGLSIVIAVAILLPLLYVLSMGPAYLIYVKHPTCWPILEKIYLPLVWLHDNNTAFRDLMDRYIELWTGPDIISV